MKKENKTRQDVVDNENTNESGLKLEMSSLMQPIMIIPSLSYVYLPEVCKRQPM
jgi:hypothetical protein